MVSIYRKKQKKIKKLFIFFLSFALSWGQDSLSQPKVWEYTETKCGTIRRIAQSEENSQVRRGFGELFKWSSKIAVVIAVALCLDLLGAPLVWLVSALTVRKFLMWSTLANGRYLLLRRLTGAATVCFGWIALIGTVFLVSCSTAEASGAVAAVSVPAEQLVSALGAECVLDDRVALIRPRYNISIQEQMMLLQRLCKDSQVPSPCLLSYFPQIRLTVGQLNRIRKEWGLSGRRGRPCKVRADRVEARQSISCLPKVGAHLFAGWVKKDEQFQQSLQAVYAHIESYKRDHPEENFRLLHARKDTIEKKWLALHIIAILGVKKLTELDYNQHDLATVIGNYYSSSTLVQFLGDLERVALGLSLRKVLSAGAKGQFCYIDGHMIAFWSRLKMHKGHITMLGRIMAGSNSVLAHDETGQAIDVEYHPPDMHLGHIIEDYCRNITELTGIRRFIIDREVNSVKTANLFADRQWGLICLLDANEYKGLKDFRKKYAGKLEDGTILYKANWQPARNEDPRRFIIVQEADRCLVYWCTSDIAKQFSARQIIALYRMRAEIQENGIKRMIAHGALNTNYGIKNIWSTDRTHQRKIDKIDEKREKLVAKRHKLADQIEDQLFKIQESIERKHGRLLDKRLAKLSRMEGQEEELNAKLESVESQKQALGPPCRRADRDFRKQTIMTCRTLFLENALRRFTSSLSRFLKAPIDIEILLDLFFLRRGVCVETEQNIVYWIDSSSLSRKYRDILKDIAKGCHQIFLTHRGKAVSFEISGFT